ncbi:DUF4959 domain-containing protein [Pedobacter nyackensis]|uniref:DUF4959 domain-containing protein n=1 Tax=Pedobacter nyackensis TaxID=475255 RepID=A0A1W2EUT1_9SPHI|nr:DUF4959 domain-containing protein [Pedobacter nyackensis]SMD13467.1 protein of unknown function [Pedobacter nyackensis]
MKALKTILSLLIIAMLFNGCKEDKIEPIDSDKTPPGKISNVVVEAGKGSAKITYTLPNSSNLLYVKAVFEIKPGVIQEAKSSYYKNEIIVEGFSNTDERNIKLYAVSRAEVSSEAVIVKVKPLPAPVYDVFSTLDVTESFGGFVVKFENPAANSLNVNSNIRIGVLRYDPVAKEWNQIDMHYSGLVEGKFSVRGLVAEKQKFGFFIKDRFDNVTDTLVKEMTPIFEEQLNGALIKHIKSGHPVPQLPPLPLDGSPVMHAEVYSSSWELSKLFNDVYGGSDGFHTKERFVQPIWVTMDLGVKAKLSRYKWWQRLHDNNETYFYSHGNPHQWEIWGTNDLNDVNSWVKLDGQVLQKPSGLPVGILSNDDREAARAGHEYEFANHNIAVRYIAWKNIDSWASIEGTFGLMHLAELKIWGQIQK